MVLLEPNVSQVMKTRLPSECVIMKDIATARNTGWCSEGAEKKTWPTLPPPAFQFPANASWPGDQGDAVCRSLASGAQSRSEKDRMELGV